MQKQLAHLVNLIKSLRKQDRLALGGIVVFVFAASLVFIHSSRPTAILASAAVSPASLEEITVEAARVPAYIPTESDILWLARAIYSETKQPHEQELVAWVVRNRFETNYRGQATYQGVVLDRLQFSAFNEGSGVRSFYMNLQPTSESNGWKAAIGIARRVATSDTTYRPFSRTTRHFYSEQSMVGRREPVWAMNKMPVKLPQVKAERFRFYENVN